MFGKSGPQCPKCYSKNVKEERWEVQPSPDHEDIDLFPVVIFCRDCKWSFNTIGAKKRG